MYYILSRILVLIQVNYSFFFKFKCMCGNCNGFSILEIDEKC